MQYETYVLPNGLRMIHLPSQSPVFYCGFAVNAGTRDEMQKEFGLAHFVEHMLFKGTKKRKAWHILNRMENVGGELNAYTTKEETFIYATSLVEDAERSVELLSDIVSQSQFPEKEIEKEREVVLDEINSYKDNPSELIFDDFENLLFSGHAIGHYILGEEKTLNKFDKSFCDGFVQRFYHPSNMIFFSYGKISFTKMIKLASKYMLFDHEKPQGTIKKREAPSGATPQQIEANKQLFQTHVMIGAKGYGLHENKRTGLYLLNNILGGPGMNSRLNLSLREKYGLVYNVESNLTTYSDTGVISIYFGCDPKSKDKCLSLVYKELKKLREVKLNTTQLSAAKKQLKGQLGISSDHGESIALGMGKSFLHLNKYNSLLEVYNIIDSFSADTLLEIANEILDENKLFRLIYE